MRAGHQLDDLERAGADRGRVDGVRVARRLLAGDLRDALAQQQRDLVVGLGQVQRHVRVALDRDRLDRRQVADEHGLRLALSSLQIGLDGLPVDRRTVGELQVRPQGEGDLVTSCVVLPALGQPRLADALLVDLGECGVGQRKHPELRAAAGHDRVPAERTGFHHPPEDGFAVGAATARRSAAGRQSDRREEAEAAGEGGASAEGGHGVLQF